MSVRLLVILACAAVAVAAAPAPAQGAVSFAPATGSPYYVATESCGSGGHHCGNVYAVPATDLNGDGQRDVAAVVSPTSVLPLLGSSGGQLAFGSAHMFAPAGTFSRFGGAAADFNADGNPDVVVTLGSGPPSFGSGFRSVAVMLGDGAGGFDTASRVDPGGEAPEGLAVGDLNGDGNQDVAVANFSTDNVSILLGDGAGGLAPAPGSPVPVGDGPWAVAAADLDHDGDRDLAVVNRNADTISILLGDGAGGFAAAPGAPVAVGRGVPASIAVGDFNEDGDADLTAAGFAAPSGVAVLLGDGAGGFNHAPGSPHSDGNIGSWAVGVGDFNRDGNQDVASTNNGANSISVRLGNGAGSLGAPSTHSVVTGESLPLSDCPRPGTFTIACSPRSISIADFDGDGSDDVVAGNWNAFSVSVLLNRSNSAPVAHDDGYAIDEDVSLTVAAPGVLHNDTDPDGDALTAALASGTSHGTLSLNADGSFSYTPETDFSGSDSFSYRAGDGAAHSNVATVSITVRPINDPPVVQGDAYDTNEDAPLSVPAPGVLDNDFDPEGDSLSAELVSGPGHGTLSLDADGSFTYTPEPDFAGADFFNYRAGDGHAESGVATVSLTVWPANDRPLAHDDEYAIDEDAPLQVEAPGVLGNDTDPDGDGLNAALASGPSHGTLNLNGDGSFSYTPAAHFSGTDSFRYKAGDGVAESNVAMVSITVRPVNDPPRASDDQYVTDEDVPLGVPAPGVLANDADPDGDALSTYPLVSGPAHGRLHLDADGSFTYTPEPSFSGTDAFHYLNTDGTLFSNVATVSITVRPVNDAPLARDDHYSTHEDTPLTVVAPGVLENDIDQEGDALGGLTLVAGPAHGTLNLDPDGSFSYTPDQNFSGNDSFRYEVSDGTATSEVATVSITVDPVNDPPLAHDDEYATDEEARLIVQAPGVLGNDTDPDGDALTAVLGSAPAHGTLDFNTDGSFIYTPAPNFSGSDSFRYRASDQTDQSNLATVTITVRPVNDAPVAHDDEESTDEDTPLSVPAPGVLGNDTDAEGPLHALLVSEPAHGVVNLDANGSYTYEPAHNFSGDDSFTYRASDGTAQSNLATVTITVRPVNDAPLARDDEYVTDEDARLIVQAPGVLGNDADPDGDPVTAVLASAPAHGTLAFYADGSFAYRPAPDYSGSDSFRYRASDETDQSNLAATVKITVRPANDILFASTRSGNGDIYSLDPNGGVPTQLTSGNAIDAEPVWSPDRAQIAFTSTRDGNVEIYAMDADGGSVRRLTTSSAADTSPAWSPDGTRIAFTSNRAGGNRDIYVMSAATGANVTRLTTHAAADTAPAWSPDGTAIAFSSARTAGGDIYSMLAAPNAVQTRLTTSSGLDTEPAWFGSTIAFSTNRHGSSNFEIYTMSETGSGQSRRTTQSGHDVTPAWSPDGAKLAFATNRHGGFNFEIYTMNADGSGQTRLTNHPAFDAFPDW